MCIRIAVRFLAVFWLVFLVPASGVGAEAGYVDLPTLVPSPGDLNRFVPSSVVLRVSRETNDQSVMDLSARYDDGDRSPQATAGAILGAFVTGAPARYVETAKLTDRRTAEKASREFDFFLQHGMKDVSVCELDAIFRMDTACLVPFEMTHPTTRSFSFLVMYEAEGNWRHWQFHAMDPLYQTLGDALDPATSTSAIPARPYAHSVRYPAPGAEPDDAYAAYVMFDGVVPAAGARVFGGERGWTYLPAELPNDTTADRVLVAFRLFMKRASEIYSIRASDPRDEAAYQEARGMLSGGALAEWDEKAAGDAHALQSWILSNTRHLRVKLLMDQGPSWRVWFQGDAADRIESLEMAEIDGEYRIIHALGMQPDIAVHTSDVVRAYVKGLAGEE